MFEWAIKFHSKRCRGIASREKALDTLMRKERWTSNSPLASEVPLSVEFSPVHYGVPPEEYTLQTNVRRRQTSNRRGTFSKNLHGVRY